ncbi:uncharacterized protein PRCAT00001500001 [Priceomyces carsonii]|uniref:uncharacterized protein n=1 Tax=Priceomyces carsonii TaxID=28549 RepID=UPI002EDAF2D0|nr:unnamed protein product [Priceomyces carsonii]
MKPRIFDIERLDKETVIVFEASSELAIKFSATDKCNIYVASNLELFGEYTKQVIEQSKNIIHAIVIFKNFKEFFKVLSFLRKIGEEVNGQKHQIDHIKPSNHPIQNEEAESEVIVSELPHEFDTIQPFKLYVILDSALLKPDVLSDNSIAVQQYLRFFTLKHKGKMIASSKIDLIVNEPMELIEQGTEPKLIYDNSSSDSNAGSKYDIYIPEGWDSWKKIMLVAKSALYSGKRQILSSEDDFKKLDDIYSAFLNYTDDYNDLLTFIGESETKASEATVPLGDITFEMILEAAQKN